MAVQGHEGQQVLSLFWMAWVDDKPQKRGDTLKLLMKATPAGKVSLFHIIHNVFKLHLNSVQSTLQSLVQLQYRCKQTEGKNVWSALALHMFTNTCSRAKSVWRGNNFQLIKGFSKWSFSRLNSSDSWDNITMSLFRQWEPILPKLARLLLQGVSWVLTVKVTEPWLQKEF